MTTDHTRERAAALILLQRGEATLSEIAGLAGVERQAVYYWARVAKIDVAAARESHLSKLWRRSLKS